MVATTADIEASLTRVLCPCALAMGHEVDMVSMGKIENIAIADRRATIRLIESPMCFFIRPITRSIEDAVLEVAGIDEVKVEFSGTTLWTPDLMRRETGSGLAVADHPQARESKGE
jgi:metal-sulfur cluster biosynthetic enzyme